jgi:hypothetical protein
MQLCIGVIIFILLNYKCLGGRQESHRSQSQHELSEALLKVNGIYVRDSYKRAQFNNTVIIASVNEGYVDFFFNLKCFLDALDMQVIRKYNGIVLCKYNTHCTTQYNENN